jgi:uncharacterized membrane protein YoaK (UPF0700 family)
MEVRQGTTQRRIGIAVVLTWASGFVDAACSIALMHVFVANMSGNSIAIGLGAARGEWADSWRRALAVPMFFFGLLVSRALVHAAKRVDFERVGAALFVLVSLLLVAYAAVGQPVLTDRGVPVHPLWRYCLLVALPSMAMGIQNAALTKFGPLTVRTTHVTGTLAVLADYLSEQLLWMRGRTRGRGLRRCLRVLAVTPRREDARKAAFLSGVWTSYVIGGFIGALAQHRFGLWSVALPVVVYGALAFFDLFRPVLEPEPIREERGPAL